MKTGKAYTMKTMTSREYALIHYISTTLYINTRYAETALKPDFSMV